MRRRRNPEIIAGVVNSDGSIAAGDGFSAQKLGTGSYALSFPSSFRVLSVTATPAIGGNRGTDSQKTAAGVTISTFVSTTSAAIDVAFHFVAAGVQQ